MTDRTGIVDTMPFLKISDIQGFQLSDIMRHESLKTPEEAIAMLITEYREKYEAEPIK